MLLTVFVGDERTGMDGTDEKRERGENRRGEEREEREVRIGEDTRG